MSVFQNTAKGSYLINDVGANCGRDLNSYLKKVLRVPAFQAHPDNAAYGLNRCSAEIARARLTVVAAAITNDVSKDGDAGQFDKRAIQLRVRRDR